MKKKILIMLIMNKKIKKKINKKIKMKMYNKMKKIIKITQKKKM